jgi:3-phosphoshikimate 1-carboxyvinyltransferase
MIAPVLKKGLELNLAGKAVSPSYIQLTLKLMQLFGIKHEWKGSVIIIHNQVYKPYDITVEADWSSASYWYEMAAMAEKADLMIRGLSKSGLQGDSVLSELFEKFGVKTEFTKGAVKLTSKPQVVSRFDYDFINQPDLVQTFAVLCALRGIPFRLEGTQTLRVKETDRVHALKQELAKFGIRLDSATDGSWIEFNDITAGAENQLYRTKGLAHGTKSRVHEPDSKVHKAERTIKIRTYQDHRMAMAFTPAAIQGYRIDIDNPGVVSKSYPGFWEDIKKAGFRIRQKKSS